MSQTSSFTTQRTTTMKKKNNIAQPVEEKLSASSGAFKLIPLGFSKICLCTPKTENVKKGLGRKYKNKIQPRKHDKRQNHAMKNNGSESELSYNLKNHHNMK